MPLAEMGLVSRFDESDAPLLRGLQHASQREVRCAAGFYGSLRQAEAVAATLRRQMGLRSEQLSVVQPEGLTRAAFHREARQWQQRRPRGAWRQSLAQLALGTVAGLITGGLASTVAYLTLAAPDTGLDAWSWLQPGLWAGAAAGAVASSVFLRQPRHRFDQTVARKLRQGFCVVVAHGLSPADEASVLACIQDTSHSWCAEAPQRPQRL